MKFLPFFLLPFLSMSANPNHYDYLQNEIAVLMKVSNDALVTNPSVMLHWHVEGYQKGLYDVLLLLEKYDNLCSNKDY